jgi:hypothetical protein
MLNGRGCFQADRLAPKKTPVHVHNQCMTVYSIPTYEASTCHFNTLHIFLGQHNRGFQHPFKKTSSIVSGMQNIHLVKSNGAYFSYNTHIITYSRLRYAILTKESLRTTSTIERIDKETYCIRAGEDTMRDKYPGTLTIETNGLIDLAFYCKLNNTKFVLIDNVIEQDNGDLYLVERQTKPLNLTLLEKVLPDLSEQDLMSDHLKRLLKA